MNFDEAFSWLNSLSNFKMSSYNLVAINELLEKLDRPDKNLKYVHIAGTNGKGSVAKMCSEALIVSGKKTGLFISPHILSFNERIQINGKFIKDSELLRLIEHIKPVVEKIAEGGVFCSQFDVITAAAFTYFNLSRCDIVVLEVGLGGRFDSTNVIFDSEISIITKISFDHEKELGSTLQKIAYEKAGIIKKNGVCVCSAFESDQVLQVLKEVCFQKNAQLVLASMAENIDVKYDKTTFDFEGEHFNLNLKGAFQVENAMIAITAMALLGISVRNLKVALGRVFWPARFEILKTEPVLILDGAHNVDGVKALKLALDRCFLVPKIGVFSMLERKNYSDVLKELQYFNFEKIILTQMNEPGVVKVEQLQNLAQTYNLNFVTEKNYNKALNIADTLATSKGLILVFGSLYFVSQVRNNLIK